MSATDIPGGGPGYDTNGSAQITWTVLTPTVSMPVTSTAYLGDPDGTLSATVTPPASASGYQPTGVIAFTDAAGAADSAGAVAEGL